MISVSARKSIGVPVLDYLRNTYPYSLDEVDSVFGFSEFCTLYGGRPYWGEELTDGDLSTLYDKGIGYRIPLTNHDASVEEFKAAEPLLKKHHRKGNTVICVNDDLANWIAWDYPLYTIEASAIKKLDKLDKIEKALELYDSVVPPANCSDSYELLESIKEKGKVRLFIRAGCAYNCKSRICYKSFSNHMRNKDTELLCSMRIKPRQSLGAMKFDMKQLQDMGFTKFKAVP